jgi:hypothetical protein
MLKSTDKKSYVFIADFFVNQIAGGGELNNEEAINILKSRNSVVKINSHFASPAFIKENLDKKFIIGNFINLSPESKQLLVEEAEYTIYEHDHKYLQTRDPSVFEDFRAPESAIINRNFYKNASAVLCQSSLHAEIVRKNLGYDNVINLGGNLWSKEILNFLENLSLKKKENKISIMQSTNPIKNTRDAVMYCKVKKIDFELIPSQPYKNFLTSLGKNDTFVFFPKTAETLSRIVVEARMMGMTVITNKLVGALSEDWFELKGNELIDVMREKRKAIADILTRDTGNQFA